MSRLNKFEDEDDYGLLDHCFTQKSIDKIVDNEWEDNYQRDYKYKYETYILLDRNKNGIYKFGPFTFPYEPFYVGYGLLGRGWRSADLWDQYDNYNLKVQRMKEIGYGKIGCSVIGRYYTKQKAALVERKLMNLIPRKFLHNSIIRLCEIPLTNEDYSVYANNTFIQNKCKERQELDDLLRSILR